MSTHATELARWLAGILSAVRPYSTSHVVAGTQEQVGKMWAPSYLSDSVSMTLKQLNGTFWLSYVKRADDAVDTGCGEHGRSVLVPVVSQRLGWRERGLRSS